MAVSVVRIDEKGVNELFHSRTGDVHKHMENTARKIVVLAKAKVGKRTRRLEHSIGYRMLNTPNGVYAEIGASARIALIHHEGSRPHVILPTHSRVLRFKQGGQVVYARKVHHPGTRPNRYLLDAMVAIIR